MNISDRARKSVAFLGIKKGGKFLPRATAFFVQCIEDQHRFDHLVTAEHVISGLLAKNHKIWLRVNLVGGNAKEFPMDGALFTFHPNSELEPTDVAVTPINTVLADEETGETLRIDVAPLLLHGPSTFIPTEQFAKESIVLGGEIAIIGLFRSHYGANRIVPIVRVGNISALLDEPIFTKYVGHIAAYLVEARSISGLSGSPVFCLPDSGILVAKAFTGVKNYQSAALLGLMHGHFDVPNLNEDVVADDDEPERSVHTGIGVVVPLSKILETINHPDLVAMRKKIVKDLRESSGAKPDLAPDDEDLPATDVNPNHREGFTSLLNAAAKKPEPKD